MPAYVFKRYYSVERYTIIHVICQTCFYYVKIDPDNAAHDIFTDNGDLELVALYYDMVAANRKAIAKEEAKRLRV